MKTIYKFFPALYLFSFFFSDLLAQPATFEKTIQPHFYSEFSFTAPSPGGHWIAAGNYQDLASGFFTPGYLASFDSLGNTDWKFAFVDTGETITVTDLIRTNDDQYLITGWQHYCDFGDIICYLKKFDAIGNVAWTKYRVIPGFYPSADPVACQLESGTYVIGIDTVLHFATSSGDSISEVTFMNDKIYNLMETNIHQLVACSENGLTVLDTIGTQINFLPYSSGVKKIVQREDSSFLVLSGKKIFILGPSFSILDSIDLSSDFASVKTMKYDLSNLWLLGKNATSPLTKVITMDSSGSISPVLMLTDSALIANDFAIDSLHVMLCGKENSATSNHMYAGTFLHDGTHINNATDAGVVNVRYDSVWAVHSGGPPAYNTIYFDTYVTIKNFGTDTLNDFFLNAKLGGTICGHMCYLYRYTNMALAPNDTVEIHIGVGADAHYCLGLCSFTYCFWTSAPDSVTDHNHLNDSTCSSFSIDIIDGVVSPGNSETSFTVVPNPFTESFTIRFNDPGQKGILKLFNSIGKEMMEENIFDPMNISTHDLPRGIYLALIETAKGPFTRKIIKE